LRWRTAARGAAYKVVPAPGADQERPSADPTTVKTQPQQPPTQLPPQRSDISRRGNPPCDQPTHFTPQVLQGELSDSKTTALNSPGNCSPSSPARRCQGGGPSQACAPVPASACQPPPPTLDADGAIFDADAGAGGARTTIHLLCHSVSFTHCSCTEAV